MTIRAIQAVLGPATRGSRGIFIYGSNLGVATASGLSKQFGDALQHLVLSGQIQFIAGPRRPRVTLNR
jgi:hypothetical protein